MTNNECLELTGETIEEFSRQVKYFLTKNPNVPNKNILQDLITDEYSIWKQKYNKNLIIKRQKYKEVV